MNFSAKDKKILLAIVIPCIIILAYGGFIYFKNHSGIPDIIKKDSYTIAEEGEPYNFETGVSYPSRVILKGYKILDSAGNPIKFVSTGDKLSIQYSNSPGFTPLEVETVLNKTYIDTFLFNIWPTANRGDHIIRIDKANGTQIDIPFRWQGAGHIEDYKITMSKEGARIDLEKFKFNNVDRFYYMSPSQEFIEKKRGEYDGEYLIIPRDMLVKGTHVILINESAEWFFGETVDWWWLELKYPEDFN